MFYVFVLVCLSGVVSFHFKEFICIILLLCVFCDKTKWFSLFASCGPSSFFVFVVLF